MESKNEVTIVVPEIPAGMQDADVVADAALMKKLESAVGQWSDQLREFMNTERRLLVSGAEEAAYWSARSNHFLSIQG